MRRVYLLALVASPWLLTACGRQVEATPATSQILSSDTLHAIHDFQIEVQGYAPFYREENRDGHPGLAINSIIYEDEYAAADHVWQGPTGTYDVTLGIRAEFDGEPTYILMLNNTPVRLTVAPRTEIPIEGPVPHTWRGIVIQNGQTIRVVANNTTNGLLPEGDGTGYARGRWSYLILNRVQ
jgi:hypothetical protein